MHRSSISLIVLVITAVLALGGVIWMSHQISTLESGGGYFWIEWLGARAKVEGNLSPYSHQVRTQINNQVENLFTWAPAPDLAYTSPFYSAFISLPFALISDGVLAHTIWLVLQFVVLLLVIISGIRLTAWKPAWMLFAILILFVLLSLRNILSWYQGSMLIWVSGFMVGVIFSLRSKRYEQAGILLAFTMIQPQASILWVIFVLLWAGSHRRWSLLVWFVSTLAFLMLATTLLVPEWPLQYLRILWNYADYFAPGSPAIAFRQWWPGIGNQLGWIFTSILSIVLLLEWRLAFRKDFPWFLWTSCLTISISPWIGIPTSPDAHVLLNLPLLFVFAMFSQRWSKQGKWIALAGVIIVFMWEWWLVFSSSGDIVSPTRLGLMFPLPLLLLLGLIWVRWWSVKPRRFLIEELRAHESIE